MNLSDLSRELSTLGSGEESPLVSVDISPFVGKPAGSVLLQWREPDAAQIYQIGKDAAQIKTKHQLHWPIELCIDVATVAMCHVAPDTSDKPAALFYMERAADKSDPGKKLWQFLMLSLNDAFPALKGVLFENRDQLKNYLCGLSNSAPGGQGDATRLSSGESPQAPLSTGITSTTSTARQKPISAKRNKPSSTTSPN